MFPAAMGLLAAIIAVSAVIGLARFLQRRARLLAIAERDLDIFYSTAKRLLSDETVPPTVRDVVRFFSEQAVSGKLAHRLARRILSGEFGRNGGSLPSQLTKDLDSLTDDQKNLFGQCVTFALLVSAASNIFRAEELRSIIIWGLFERAAGQQDRQVESPKAVDVAMEIARVWRKATIDGDVVVTA